LTFDRHELDAMAAWVQKAQPRSGIFYRSVSYQYMDPETVLDGRGAMLYGGRFASVGTAAVYLAQSDAVASQSAYWVGRPVRRSPSIRERRGTGEGGDAPEDWTVATGNASPIAAG
jgi:hypothetical protein